MWNGQLVISRQNFSQNTKSFLLWPGPICNTWLYYPSWPPSLLTGGWSDFQRGPRWDGEDDAKVRWWGWCQGRWGGWCQGHQGWQMYANMCWIHKTLKPEDQCDCKGETRTYQSSGSWGTSWHQACSHFSILYDNFVKIFAKADPSFPIH